MYIAKCFKFSSVNACIFVDTKRTLYYCQGFLFVNLNEDKTVVHYVKGLSSNARKTTAKY